MVEFGLVPLPVTPEESGDVMPKVDGKFFRCECGCNVFRQLLRRLPRFMYKCNSCRAVYEGWK